jgi:hypothetical protein
VSLEGTHAVSTRNRTRGTTDERVGFGRGARRGACLDSFGGAGATRTVDWRNRRRRSLRGIGDEYLEVVRHVVVQR